ncbi:MAG: SLATT domain-containing protein (plasmid) [Leptolyngbya sp. BL-A-14]
MNASSTLAAIRESFGRVVYTHKTHLKMIDQLNQRNYWIKVANLAALVLTTGGILTPIYDASPFKTVIIALTAAFALAVAVYQLSFDPALEIEAHRKCAKQLWVIREAYINLIADIKDGVLSDDQIRERRDTLVTQLGQVYQEAPDTTFRAYKEAQKALKINEEMTFSIHEIDQFLPINLRESKN